MRNLSSVIVAALAAVAIVLSGISLSKNSGTQSQIDSTKSQVDTMQAKLMPATAAFPAAATDAVDISHKPTDIPAPITRTESQKVVINLETVELNGKLADGTTYTYWTFNKTVPGPMLRVRQGDTVELHLKNNPSSKSTHSIDLHAVNGPGGGAVGTQVKPGEEKVITFKTLNPGVYVYHCASPHIPTHISMGMFGMIVVEPPQGLPKVDHEFYMMQSEIYAAGTHSDKGHQPFDGRLLYHEDPNFVVFNGAFQALTGKNAMQVKVGDTVRLYVGNAGPNLTSSFHAIGEIFDTVHVQGATEEQHNVQTTVIPSGGAVWIEFKVEVPGDYTLVDHAISRAIDKGAVAVIHAEGPAQPSIFNAPNATKE